MQACYRKPHGWKYELMKPYQQTIDFELFDLRPDADIDLEYVGLDRDGNLHISERYAWDGASGPALDTKTIMRASLVHDALYQLMRRGKLDDARHRKPADRLMHQMCRADGMFFIRAGYVYLGLRWFGGFAARRGDFQTPTICVGRD